MGLHVCLLTNLNRVECNNSLQCIKFLYAVGKTINQSHQMNCLVAVLFQMKPIEMQQIQ